MLPVEWWWKKSGKPSAVFFCREMQSGTGQGIAKSFKPRSFNAQELQDLVMNNLLAYQFP